MQYRSRAPNGVENYHSRAGARYHFVCRWFSYHRYKRNYVWIGSRNYGHITKWRNRFDFMVRILRFLDFCHRFIVFCPIGPQHALILEYYSLIFPDWFRHRFYLQFWWIHSSPRIGSCWTLSVWILHHRGLAMAPMPMYSSCNWSSSKCGNDPPLILRTSSNASTYW